MIGRTISHYRILGKLGQGGMGEVFLAQDTKLPRKVALKFLSEETQRDETARKRFLREAQSSAAIDHPFICNIFDIGESDGRTFLALEYVEGPTLAEKLAEGPLPIEEALKTGAEIAEALQEAHKKGIVHRDLKPSNIMYTSTGHVKIMDFGLAKLAEDWSQIGYSPLGPEASGETLTIAGLAMGTPYYMSPEQVLGKSLDPRSDIFSLGVLLYEMTTAAQPFKGDSMGAVFNEILHKAPTRARTLNPQLPTELERILKRALEKDRDLRYQSSGELLVELKRLRRETDSGQGAPIQGPAFSRRVKLSALAGLLISITAGLLLLAWYGTPAWMSKANRVAPAVQTIHQQVTFTGDARYPAISPDGQSVAFVSGKRLLLRDLAGDQDLELYRGHQLSTKASTSAKWSPDGSVLLVCDGGESGGFFLISRLGGSPRRLKSPYCGYASWSPDGTRIAAAGQTGKGFSLTNPRTGEITRFTDAELPSQGIDLQKLPGAQWRAIWDLDWSKQLGSLLISTTLEDFKSAIWTVQPDGTDLRKVYEDTARLDSPRWVPGKNAIYCFRVDGNTTELIKIRTEVEDQKYQADVLMSGLQTDSSVNRRGNFTVSADGKRLLYTRALEYANLWSFRIGEGAQPEKLTEGTSYLFEPSISPDGKWLAFTQGQGIGNIFKMRLDGGEATQLTFFDGDSRSPAWSPDGGQIAFISDQGEGYRVWIMDSDGSEPRALSEIRGVQVIWAPNSKILYRRVGNRNLHFLDPETAEEAPLVKDESVGWILHPRYSSDGRKLAVHWNRVDDPLEHRLGLWIISLEESMERFIPQTRNMSRVIGWSTDGNWIYSHDTFGGEAIHAVPLDGGEPRTLVTMPGTILQGSITPGGRRIVVSVSEIKSDIWLAQNFDPEVAAFEN